MADEAVSNEEIGSEDNANCKVNGVENREANADESLDDSKESDDYSEQETKADLSKADDASFEQRNSNSENETSVDQDEVMDANGANAEDAFAGNDDDISNLKNGSLKRTASFSFENDEDVIACDEPTSTERALEKLYSAIEKLEKEIDDHEHYKGHPPSKKPRNSSPAHSATTDTVSSRPSSGMSVRSDSELANSGNEVAGSSNTRVSLGRKNTVDLSNPLFRLPFENGWRRELVFRANVDQNMRRQADVYYYSPTGKKLRSTREVSEHLGDSNLTVENFSFFKEPLGIEDPEKEIIREAKIIKNRTDSPQPGHEKSEDSSNIITEGKRTPKPKYPKGVSPEHITPGKAKAFKVKSVGSRLGSPTALGKSNNAESSNLSPKTRKSLSSGTKSPIVDEPNKRKTRGPPVPKLIPKVTKKAENGTPNQKGGRGNKTAESKNKNYFAEFYKVNQERKYNSLVQIFQYLKMRELAAAARVCRMWREIADTPALWRSVRMKNSQVNDWQGLAAALKRHGTRHLDLRKMLLPQEAPDKIWDQFTEHIAIVDSLLRIDLCRCPASVVERVCERMPQLQVLTATSVRCSELDPAPLASLTNLQELRIKGMTNLKLTSDLKCLENLTKLKHLSITSVKDLGNYGCIAVGGLTTLESLELGECTGEVGGANLLRRLTNLTRLRLERCPGANVGSVLLRTAASLPQLQQLELINFDIKPGFEDALGKCLNVKRLLIIPTYVSQSATTNRCVLAAVLRLRSTLTHLMWGVTLELLRVTELFIDQCNRSQTSVDGVPQSPEAKQQPKGNKTVNDCIPVLKPVPSLPVEESQNSIVTGRPQVEILPLPALQRLLAAELPDTRLKLLRIPFHATWRQTFNDFD